MARSEIVSRAACALNGERNGPILCTGQRRKFSGVKIQKIATGTQMITCWPRHCRLKIFLPHSPARSMCRPACVATRVRRASRRRDLSFHDSAMCRQPRAAHYHIVCRHVLRAEGSVITIPLAAVCLRRARGSAGSQALLRTVEVGAPRAYRRRAATPSGATNGWTPPRVGAEPVDINATRFEAALGACRAPSGCRAECFASCARRNQPLPRVAPGSYFRNA